jgi:ferrous iron transport protein B
VGDAKNLERVVTLALQVGEMGLPYVLCVNMMDEATERGLSVDTSRLSARLGVPVVRRSRSGSGVSRAARRASVAAAGHARVRYPEPVERAAPISPASCRSRR